MTGPATTGVGGVGEPGTLRLVLARHAQTASNLRMALDSLPPGPPLTEHGQGQARELARALAAEPVVAVYASTALRAQQTAAPVAAVHGVPVDVVGGLHEAFVGDLEGRSDRASLNRFFAVFATWLAGDLDVAMPGGETARQVMARCERVIADLRVRHSTGVVVLVSHSALIRLVTPTLAGNDIPKRATMAALPNVGRVVLDQDPASATGWRCVEWTGVRLAPNF